MMWSLGTLIWLPIALILAVALLLLIGACIRALRDGADSDVKVLAWISGGALVILVVGTALGMYPYRAEYHQWRPIDGEVTAVSSRLLAADKAVTQRFVVTFDSGETRSCDDTRCALVKAGDHLWLTCKRKFQYAGEDGYDCNYERHEGVR